MDNRVMVEDRTRIDRLVLKILRFLRPDLNSSTMYKLYDEYFGKLRAILLEDLEEENG